MPSWKKVIISGSNAVINDITLSGDATTIGSDFTLANTTGDLTITNNANDKDIILKSDDTAGLIDSDSTLTLRANNTAGARIQLTNANGITQFYNGSTAYAQLDGTGTDLELKSLVSNATFTLRGNDGGSEIDMLSFDVANGGNAQFLKNISGSQIEASGDVIAFGSSDERLKDNITYIHKPIDKINKIGGYKFTWNNKQDTYLGKDVGVLAQEIEAVLPELVTTRATGYKAVKYEKIVPLLIEGIKELDKKIKHIEKNCDCLNK